MISTPIWVLLAFAGWTLALLVGTVGVYRWTLILSGRATIAEFPADRPRGSDWYRRAIRAHANCVENLPVYAAIVLAAQSRSFASPLFDALAVTMLIARVAQSLVHLSFVETTLSVGVRFACFFAQIVCMAVMGSTVALSPQASLPRDQAPEPTRPRLEMQSQCHNSTELHARVD